MGGLGGQMDSGLIRKNSRKISNIPKMKSRQTAGVRSSASAQARLPKLMNSQKVIFTPHPHPSTGDVINDVISARYKPGLRIDLPEGKGILDFWRRHQV